VVSALNHAWQQARMIHRDVKPDNVFIAHTGQVKLGDLGLVKTFNDGGSALTKTGMAVGSPPYASPEQIHGLPDIDFRADIYSLGCTLYHILSGKRPFDAGNSVQIMMLQVSAPPPSILSVLPGCPQPIVTLLNKMLAKDRNVRHGSYEELTAALQQIQVQINLPP